MATTSSPYGLKPVKRVDGLPYSGAVNHYRIDPAGEATNIFQGSIVIVGADGYIAISTATGADLTTNNLGGSSIGAVGVFVGCSYTNSEGQTMYNNYYPSGSLNGVAYVVDDPNVLFQAQLDAVSGVDDLNTNTLLPTVQSTSTGNTSTGVSNTALDATVQTTAGAFRIVDFVSPTDDAFPDVLVAFNSGAHRNTGAVGI
jgi:hypothetical protein